MSYDSLGRYSPTHKAWDQFGHIIPEVEYSEGIRPHGEFKPAAWLPTKYFDRNYNDYFVLMPGKIVAFDNDGRLCPAQYGLGSATITYSTTDTTAGVIDVRTGVALVSGAEGTFNVSAVTNFMGRTGVAMAVSKPVGVCPYPYWQWAGDGGTYDDGFNPAGYRYHNYNLQHRTAILCDYVLELPLVPAQRSTPVAITQTSRTNNVAVLDGTFTNLLPMAKNTIRTAVTFAEGVGAPGDVATKFLYEKDTAAAVTAAGDWHLDLTDGTVTVYSSTDIGATDYTIAFYHYGSAPTGTSVSQFASALGDLKAGDFVKCNADSNFVVATPKTNGDGETDAFDTFADIIGQVIEVESVYDKDALGRVRTAYESLNTLGTGALPGYAGQLDQMPGSATGGVTDKVHYAGAADKVVRINLISR